MNVYTFLSDIPSKGALHIAQRKYKTFLATIRVENFTELIQFYKEGSYIQPVKGCRHPVIIFCM
jgi:hypothetical protein